MAIPDKCKRCGSNSLNTRQNGVHVELFCESCDSHQKFISRRELNLESRTVQSVHKSIKPKLRTKVLLRANTHCEMCGKGNVLLHVGHLVSVEAGIEAGLETDQINHDENLCAMCAECNLGLGGDAVPLRLALAILKNRTKNK